MIGCWIPNQKGRKILKTFMLSENRRIKYKCSPLDILNGRIFSIGVWRRPVLGAALYSGFYSPALKYITVRCSKAAGFRAHRCGLSALNSEINFIRIRPSQKVLRWVCFCVCQHLYKFL